MKRLAVLAMILCAFKIHASEVKDIPGNNLTSSPKTQTARQLSSSVAPKTKYQVPDTGSYVFLGTSTHADGLLANTYVITSSTQIDGDILKVRSVLNYEDPPVGNAGIRIVSIVADMQVDCNSKKRYRTTNYDFFAKPFGEGDSIGQLNRLDSGTANWIPITKGSTWESFARHFCNRNAEEKRFGAANSGSHTPNEENPRRGNSYAAKVKAKIKANVVLPPHIEGNPACVYRVKQKPNGDVESVELRKSSGNPELDEAVKNGILRASPLPLPDGMNPEPVIDITYVPKRPFESPPKQ